jgi:hypothetical protein
VADRPGSKEDRARPPMPFVVGVNRSGTTLLRMMLDSHPELAIPPETHFVPDLIALCERAEPATDDLVATITAVREWRDFGLDRRALAGAFARLPRLEAGPVLRAFYGLCAEQAGKPRAGEKTPAYGRSMLEISAALPEARFVHVIRDGRDVALSIRDRTPADRPKRPIGRIARRWKRRIEDAREQAERLEGAYREVRYERLVGEPELALREICAFVELPWDAAMLDYTGRAASRLREMDRDLPAGGDRGTLSAERRMKTHARVLAAPDRSRIARWRRKMTAAQRREFESVAGELLAELGYELSV